MGQFAYFGPTLHLSRWQPIKKGGTFVLNWGWGADQLDQRLPNRLKEQVRARLEHLLPAKRNMFHARVLISCLLDDAA